MTLPRRHFVASTVGTALGRSLLPLVRQFLRQDEWTIPKDATNENAWQAIRKLFSNKHQGAYLNAGGLGPIAAPTIRATVDTLNQLQRDCEHGHRLIDGVRPLLAKMLRVDASELAFMRNATEGNSTVAAGLALRAGDEVILDSHAHQGGSICWMTRQKFDQIHVRSFDPVADHRQVLLDRIVSMIGPRTRVIQVSHVTAPTGARMPVEEIAKIAKDHDLWFHIDGAQSLAMFPIDLTRLGCDSYAASGHKWLSGPVGTGILFVRKDRLDELKPTDVGSYSDRRWTVPNDLEFVDKTSRLECGTRDAATIVGLGTAITMAQDIGINLIEGRGKYLSGVLRQLLADIGQIQILSPDNEELRSSIVTFSHKKKSGDEMFRRLNEAGYRCRPVREQGLSALRVSLHYSNTRTQVEGLATAVRESNNR